MLESPRNFVLKLGLILAALIFSASEPLFGQYKSQYPDIPIVDVHIHINDLADIANLTKVGAAVKEKYGSNLTFWVAVSDPGEETIAKMKDACHNRILFCAYQGRPHRGLTITADEVIAKVRNGYMGLKFWFGPASRVQRDGETLITHLDDPKFADFFAALERERVLMTSLHVADPNGPFGNRTNWMKDPVEYWQQIRAFENVVAKYPNLTIVAAHGAWLVCQDAQIDYLRYMFSKYPNLHADISATFPYMHLVNTENLRDFYIEYQDRLLYASDWSRFPDNAVDYYIRGYGIQFAILESDGMVESGKDSVPVNGLNLPREVLEKIYYKNALKLYPGLKEAMVPFIEKENK